MSLYAKRNVPFELFEVNLLDADDKQLLQISGEMGIGLNLNEMKAVQRYFSRKKRNPTDVELQTIGQTWSEHCYHKTFKGNIATPKSEIRSLFKTYIAKVTNELNPPWCISVFEDNAGLIDFEKGYAVAAKVETHNHPSAIEPFGGAATGTGGVIRDILGVWADPIACTDVLGFGPLDYDYEKLPSGTKHPRYVFRGVVAGIGHYGNNMGIPTVNGAIYFDESYVGNVVVYCGCIGILPMNRFVKNTRPGDVAVLVGGKTGRDGIHGVTFASAELTRKSEEVSRPAVQIANPIEEEKLKRAITRTRDEGLGSAITDLGGGGISCATGEMANRSNCGVYVELEKVPLKYPGMAPWEIYISESQERMLLSVPEKNLQKVLEIFEGEEVEATSIGRFTDNGILRVDYLGQRVAELDLHFMFEPPRVRRNAKWKEPDYEEPYFPEPENLTYDVFKLVASLNIASKESVVRAYDHEVKGNTVLKPLHGRYGGPNDAAVIKPLSDSWKGIVISCGMNPNYGKIDPYWMAASCIDEAVRNNTSVGGRRVALLDNFTWGNPEKSDRLGSLVRSCQACYDFAKGFRTPFISGKDSFYNESPLGPVTPTLLITAIGVIPDVKKAVSMDVKQPGDIIYIVGQTYPELGGSQYYQLRGFIGKTVPKVRVDKARKLMDSIIKAIDSRYVKSCHDLSEGGLAVAAAEMSFSGGYGMALRLENVPRTEKMSRNDFLLFSESNSRFLVEVPEKRREDFETLMKGNVYAEIGRVKKDSYLSVYGLNDEKVVDASLAELRNCWRSALGG
ncbi:MAG: phosphoribosylformylglycinamidine synthase subunit PurL [Candidatus Bathyarchaeota archaeon]|nr:phosphoribosylformylglycinamidine synthase subunit PurL [Candidatus Bathyarchaeota archaeon]MDH5622854.1 phosphoribosylformylglycinamidine synthase subunit PurL [Candidatus Bathyarchaeota archaeon]MDH5635235.1 phosphoribosylformylglycinamidine synthase subunit PurL [Candidatus Bathyarchaeota archaeon]MDH5701364.1 phosphoribosylformylglycinamidine synthase subunit PurL [Candidatus Bathyarchaeota archaeon]